MASTLTDVKNFFEEGPSGRKVSMAELKALSKEERHELIEMLDAAQQ